MLKIIHKAWYLPVGNIPSDADVAKIGLGSPPTNMSDPPSFVYICSPHTFQPILVHSDTMEDYYLPNFIFEFPSEILQRILFFAIISRLKYDKDNYDEESVRGTSRVLNLRLVCSKICQPFL